MPQGIYFNASPRPSSTVLVTAGRLDLVKRMLSAKSTSGADDPGLHKPREVRGLTGHVWGSTRFIIQHNSTVSSSAIGSPTIVVEVTDYCAGDLVGGRRPPALIALVRLQ